MIQLRKSRAVGGRSRAVGDRQPQDPPEQNSTSSPLAVPLKGWTEVNSLLDDDGLSVSENVFPTTRGLRVRGGAERAATTGGDAVTKMFNYKSSTVEKLFAATATDVYDISGLDDAVAPTADITTQTGGDYSTHYFGTVGGQFMFLVNGADAAQYFDGSAWALTTITGVATADLNYVWSHKNRVWFVEKNSNVAWYLPIDSIGGAALSFSLEGVFKLGGSLLFGSVWSQDSGDGMDDRIVFVSTLGEVAVYQGTNPGAASDWAIVGVYKCDPPMGKDAHMKTGGDLMIATTSGLVGLSAIVSKDPVALSYDALSRVIEPSWRYYAAISATANWEITKWPLETMAVVAIPSSSSVCLPVNMNTGAWTKYTGWDVQSAALFDGDMYFGSRDGFIRKAEATGNDDGFSYVARWAYSPQNFDAPINIKHGHAMKVDFKASSAFTCQLSMSGTGTADFPAEPNPYVEEAITTGSLWDIGVWDVDVWDGSVLSDINPPVVSTGWVAQGVTGETLIPQMQITMDSPNRPGIEMAVCSVLWETGAAVV